MGIPTGPVTADDLAASVTGCLGALRAGLDADWSVPAGVLETVVHTHDITRGLDLSYRADAAVCGRVLARLLPAVDPGDDPWEALLRATGRRGDIGPWRWWNRRHP